MYALFKDGKIESKKFKMVGECWDYAYMAGLADESESESLQFISGYTIEEVKE